ncbi:hypothetical protein S83_052042, partial [Arachis hypogaea]
NALTFAQALSRCRTQFSLVTRLQSLTSLSVSHSLSRKGLCVLCHHHLALSHRLLCARLCRRQNQTEPAFGRYRLWPSVGELPSPAVGPWA